MMQWSWQVEFMLINLVNNYVGLMDSFVTVYKEIIINHVYHFAVNITAFWRVGFRQVLECPWSLAESECRVLIL